MTNNVEVSMQDIRRVVNRFQKMYLCYDEQPMRNTTALPKCCESLSKNVSLL